MIAFQCRCGSTFQFPEKYAGRQVKCRNCGQVTNIPGGSDISQPQVQNVAEETNTSGLSSDAKIVIGGVCVATLIGACFLIWFFAIYDTWELDHQDDIVRLSEKTVRLIETKDSEAGVKSYDELLRLVGTRKLRESSVTSAIAAARSAAEPAKLAIQEQQRLEAKRQKEAEIASKLDRLESQARNFVVVRNLHRAIQTYQEALDLIMNTQFDNPDLSGATERITQDMRLVQIKIDEQRKAAAEEARIAGQKRLDKENEEKGLVKIDGKWVTREQAELARLRAEMEAIKNKPGKVVVTVTWKYNNFVGNKPDADAIVVLVPEKLEEKLPSQCVSPIGSKIMADSLKKKLGDKSAYLEIAGGDGKATFNQVKPGKYTAIIVSQNTNQGSDLYELEMKILGKYFDDPNTVMHKSTTVSIEVAPGETFEKSYDFGITYF